MTVKIVLAPGAANEKTINESDIVGQLNPARTHTGLGDFAATIKPDSNVDDYAQRQDRVNIVVDNDVVFTGYLHRSDRTERGATQSIGGPGIAKKLEETRPDYESLGGVLSYSSISLEDALRDYWDRTPFDNYTIYNQSTESVVSNKDIQSADTTTEWGNIVSIAATDPFHIENGNLKLAQTCFVHEAENFDAQNNTGTSNLSEASGGEGVNIINDGEWAEYTFTPDHTINGSDVGFYSRLLKAGDAPEITLKLFDSGDNEIASWIVFNQGDQIGSDSVPQWGDWAYLRGGTVTRNYPDEDLKANETYTIRVEATATGDVLFIWDLTCPVDTRYVKDVSNLDNDNGGSGGYLDDPRLYPNSESLELKQENVAYNITEATVSGSFNDTSGSQQISVSNDGGSTYLTASNTSSTTKSFTTVGRIAQVRFTLGNFGSRTTATPQLGFNGQTIDSYTLSVDGNNLVVIDELELSRDHFSNLQTLHDYGDFVWSIDHTSQSIANMPVYSFLRGDQTQTSPSEFDDPIDEEAGIKAGRYYNVIYVQGATNSGGNGPNGRPVAEVKADSSVITNDGREITGFVRDQSITTKSGAVFRARALLDAAQSNADLIGSKTITPANLLPGFSYSVDLGNGPVDKVLETIDLSYGNSIQSTAQFGFEEDIADEIRTLKSESKNIGNQV